MKTFTFIRGEDLFHPFFIIEKYHWLTKLKATYWIAEWSKQNAYIFSLKERKG
jgi:hypothetical protein